MLTLNLPTTPYWLTLPRGVRVEIRPVTTAVMAAAQAASEREDLALHVERCAERYTAVRAEICGLRKQSRRIEAAIWGIVTVLIALGAGGAQILPILRALSRGAGG